ncbi:MAG TPA: hypothetical protein VGH28_22415 [Polyangiaceae bacterium]|jgi:transcriptional regulator with AAA-type ATPase domain
MGDRGERASVAADARSPSRLALGAALVSIGYVALVAARHADRFGFGGFALLAAALGLGALGARVRARRGRGRPLAWAAWGTGIVVATLLANEESTRAAASLGAFVSAAAGVVALSRMPSLGGVVGDRKRSPRIPLVLLAALWTPAIVTLAEGLARRPSLSLWMVAGSAATSAIALVAFAAGARLERRVELGVPERLDAFLLFSGSIGVLAVTASFARALDPSPAACLACALIGGAACVASELGDPVVIRHHTRRGAAMLVAAVVLSGAFGFLLVDFRTHEALATMVVVLIAVVCGAEMPRIARFASGETNRRLEAIHAARESLRGRDADGALASVLAALREGTGRGQAGSPELWTLDPVRLLRVDAAGYPHDEAASLPPELALVACGEPESTLRAETLGAVEVRRPDLRPLSQWMRDARFASATMIARGGDIEGILFLPAQDGAPDLVLEEARALRALADDLAPLCHARAKLARSMVREQAARTAEGEATTRAERLEHQLARASAQHALAAARLARPAAVGIYSARSRDAYEALERLAKTQAPVVVIAKSGVDPVPFLARAHLAGARSSAPLVLVDCTSTREHDLDRWRDPIASPLALADGGLLVLLDAVALPSDVQRLVGQALAERRAPWERPDALDIVLAITVATLGTSAPDNVLDELPLDSVLASRVASALEDPVRLPGIAERPEDIRAIVTDRLAREGMRVRGAPVGIDDAAFAVLVEHPFEGEDAELAAIVQKLVARTAEEVVHEPDVRAVLEPEPLDPDHLAASVAGVISRKPSIRRGP